MKNNAEARPQKKTSKKQLVLFAVLVSVLMLGSLLWGEFGPALWRIWFVPEWRQKFNGGMLAFKKDQTKGRQEIDTAISEAIKTRAPAWEIVSMYKLYVDALYGREMYDQGDTEVEHAIAACPHPENNKQDADVLGMVYQARARASLDRFTTDRKGVVRIKDQEESLRLTEFAFGPESMQVAHKLSLLGVLYATDGAFDKANAVMKRAVAIAENKVHDVRWYVYGQDARMKALEHDYKSGAQSFLAAYKLAPEDRQEWVWSEFEDGIYQSVPPVYKIGNVQKWLQQGDFQQLETTMSALRKSRRAMWDGEWNLDWIYEQLCELSEMPKSQRTEAAYTKRLAELQRWNTAVPNSVSARVALADFYTDYAFRLYGDNRWHFNTPEYRGKELRKAVAVSKRILDADPNIRQKCPRSFAVYERQIKALPDKDHHFFWSNLEQSHKMWPDYQTINYAVLKNLMPWWHAAPDAAKRYITTQADTVGGAAGDARFAMLTKHLLELQPLDFEGPNSAQWARVKRGFKQILKERPSDMQARIAFFMMAFQCKDIPTAVTAWDGVVVPANAVNVEGADSTTDKGETAEKAMPD